MRWRELSRLFISLCGLVFIGYTAWKVSKYGVFSGPHFPVFGQNTEIYEVNIRIQSEYRKIQTRKNSIFGHFSRSVRMPYITLEHNVFIKEGDKEVYNHTNLCKTINLMKLNFRLVRKMTKGKIKHIIKLVEWLIFNMQNQIHFTRISLAKLIGASRKFYLIRRHPKMGVKYIEF